MINCEKGHRICKGRVAREVKSFLAEGKTDFSCPAIRCDCPLSREIVLSAIPPDLRKALIAAETALALIVDAIADEIVKCAHCGTPFAFDGFGVFKCSVCSFETCSICGCPPHEGACHRSKANHVTEDGNEIEPRIVTCPSCQTAMNQEPGCNLRTCPKCKTGRCDFCDANLPAGLTYGHFWGRPGEVCPPNCCPLWHENPDPKTRGARLPRPPTYSRLSSPSGSPFE
jgi:hypothetical protein